MNKAEAEEFLKSYENAKPYELLYSLYLYFVMILSISLNILIFWMFLGKKSRIGQELRLIFSHSILCAALLTIVICLWQPFVFPPSIGGFPTTYSIFNYFGVYGFLIGFWVICGLNTHLGVTFTLGFAVQSYRLKLSEPRPIVRAIFEWFQSVNNTRLFLNCSFIGNFLITSTLIVNFSMNLIHVDKIPTFAKILQKHPALCLVETHDNHYLVFCICLCSAFIIIEVVYCIKTNCTTIIAVRSTSDLVTSKTFKAQMHLYRLFSFQLLIMILFFCVPLVITSLEMLNILNWANCGTLNICFMAMHSPMQAFVAIIGYPRKKLPGTSSSTKTTEKQ